MNIVSLNIARPETHIYGDETIVTGGYKQPVASAFLRFHQLDGDGQGDEVNHGGPDKAVNAYAHEHYAYWQGVFDAPLPPAAFGENLTLGGALEEDVCIGDVYAIGTALLQVSQPRVPCFKLKLKHGKKHLVNWVRATGYTGFYLRVLREGLIESGAKAALIDRDSDVTIADINTIYYARAVDAAAIDRALSVDALATAARALIAQRLQGPI